MIYRKSRPKTRNELLHHILRSYSISVIFGSAIIVLWTLITSVFYDYRVTVLTNNIGECHIEIMILTTGIIIFAYESLLTRMKNEEKKEVEK